MVFVFVFVIVFDIVSFFGQVMHPYHSQMSQRSQVSGIALFRCSLNVFVFVIVFSFVFVFFFVIVFVSVAYFSPQSVIDFVFVFVIFVSVACFSPPSVEAAGRVGPTPASSAPSSTSAPQLHSSAGLQVGDVHVISEHL